MSKKSNISIEKKSAIAIKIKSGETIRDIAKEFGVSKGAVQNVSKKYKTQIREVKRAKEEDSKLLVGEFSPSDLSNY